MNAMSKTSKSGGCGCGGAGKNGGCGCGSGVQALLCSCGDVGCNTCRNQGFVRPRFFAGQLLTEEDLQKLIDYTVAKNRLHNQRLWGDGVVCGLEVGCNPCGGGKVTVNPGYALDCCGNDLVLSCPQELDINAMVRDLKRSLRGGYDCGDPCPPPKKKPDAIYEQQATVGQGQATTGNLRLPNRVIKGQVETEEEPPKDITRHYCLYIRYCENLTEPVSPYATDEGCSYQSCQPTRVSEGVSFELRCKDCSEHDPDIRDRICECLGDVDSAFQTTLRSNSFYTASKLMEEVTGVVYTDRITAGRNFLKTSADLQKVRIPAPAPVSNAPAKDTRSVLDTSGAAASTINVDEFEGWLSYVRAADAHLASYYLAKKTPNATKEIITAEGPIEEQVRFGQQQLLQQTEALKAIVKDVPASELQRGYYDAALRHTAELASGPSAVPVERLQQIAAGRLLLSADFQSSKPALAAMKEELLDRLDQSPRLGDCQLRFDVESIRIPGPESPESDWLNAFKQLHTAWVRYLKDCICAALNPACAPCEDPAVLLACLEVKDCEVIEICNLKRNFVLSGPALRYWFPPLNMLGDKIEELCCPDPICIEEPDPATNVRGQAMSVSRYPIKRPTPGRVNFSLFRYLCRSQKKQASLVHRVSAYDQSVARQLGEDVTWQDAFRSAGASLLQRVGMPAFAMKQPAAGTASHDDQISAVLNNKGFTDFVAGALKTEASRIDKAIAEATKERVAAATSKITANAAKDRKEFKQISKENAKLQKTITELSERAKALQDRVVKLEKGTPT